MDTKVGTDVNLFTAVIHDSPKEWEGELNKLCSVDIRNSNQRTLLHTAIEAGTYEWVKILLMTGADPTIRDGRGLDALQMAKFKINEKKDDLHRKFILDLIELAVGVKYRDNSTKTIKEDVTSGENINAVPEVQEMDILEKENVLSLKNDIASLAETVNNIQGKMCSLWPGISISCVNDKTLIDEVKQISNVKSNVTKDPTATSIVRDNSVIDEEKTKGKDKGGIVQKASGKVKDESKIITNAGSRSKLQKADREPAVPLEESSKLVSDREISRDNSEIDEEKTKSKDEGGIVQKARGKVKDESKIITNSGSRSKLQKADGERAQAPVSKVETGSSQGMYERNARCNKSDGTHFSSTVVSGDKSKNSEDNETRREKSFNEAKSSANRKVPERLELIEDILQKLSVQGKHEKPSGKPSTFPQMSDSSVRGGPLSTGGITELVPDKLNIDKRKEISLAKHLPEITNVGENVEADNESIGEGNACAAIVDKVGGGSKGTPESITDAGSRSKLQKADREGAMPSEEFSKLMSGRELSQAPVSKVEAGSRRGMYERNARCNKSDGTHFASSVVSGEKSKNSEDNGKKQEKSLREANSSADWKVPGRLELIRDMLRKFSVQGKLEKPSGKPSTFPQMSDSSISGGPLSTGGLPELVPEKLNIDKRKEMSLTKHLPEITNVGENVEADIDSIGEENACAGIVDKVGEGFKGIAESITDTGSQNKLQKAEGECAVPWEESSKLMNGRELFKAPLSKVETGSSQGMYEWNTRCNKSDGTHFTSTVVSGEKSKNSENNVKKREKFFNEDRSSGDRKVPERLELIPDMLQKLSVQGKREILCGKPCTFPQMSDSSISGGPLSTGGLPELVPDKLNIDKRKEMSLTKDLPEITNVGENVEADIDSIGEENACAGIVDKVGEGFKGIAESITDTGSQNKLQKAEGESAVPWEESSKLMNGRELFKAPLSKVKTGSSQGMCEWNTRCNKSDGTHFTSTVVSGEKSKNSENNEKKREKSLNEAKSSADRKVPERLELKDDMLQKLSVQGKREILCGKPSTFPQMSDSSIRSGPLSTGGLPELVLDKLNIYKGKEMSLTKDLPEITNVGENVEADNDIIGEESTCAAIVDKVSGGSKGIHESITDAEPQSKLQKADGEGAVPREESSKLMNGRELFQAPSSKVKAGSRQGMYERNARCNKSDGTHFTSTVVSGEKSKNSENNEKKRETSLNEAKSSADRKVPGRLELITDMMQKLSVQGKHEILCGKPSTFPQMSDSSIRGGPLSTGGIPELVPDKLNIDKRKEMSLTKGLSEITNVGENLEADNDLVGEKKACANDRPLGQLKKVVEHVADIAGSSQRLSELQVTEEEHLVPTPVSCNNGSGLELSQDQFFKDILSSGNEKLSMANYESGGCIMSNMMIQAYKCEGNVSMHQAPREMLQLKEEMSCLRSICHTDVDSTVEELDELCIHDTNDGPANELGKISAICLDSVSKKSCTSPHGRDTMALKLRLEGMADDLKPTAGISDGESCYAPCCMQKYQREKESDRGALDSDPQRTSENTPHDKDFSQKKNHVSADSHVNSSSPENEIASADVQISADESETLSSSTAVFEDLNVPGEHHGSPKPTFIGKGNTKSKKPISDQVPNWKYSFSSFLPFKKDNSKQSSVNEELVGEGNASEGNKSGEEPADCVGAKMTTVTGRSSVLGSSFQLPMTDLSKSRESKEMDESQVRRFGHNSREIKETQLQNAEYVATPEMKCLQRKTSHVGQPCPNECQVVDLGNSDLSNQQCVHAMMEMTKIHGNTERKSSFVRKLYEKMYSLCHLSSIMMKFLSGQTKVIIKIDCDSENIQRIKDKFKDYDEQSVNGSNRSSFADFEEEVIYLAIPMNEKKEKQIIGRFCSSLCLMSVYLAFKNGGKPYLEGDRKNREVYRKLISEATTKKKSREELVRGIKVALEKKTLPGKEIAVIAALSQIISQHGFKEGSSLLRNQLPSLLEFFENHVVSTIKKKCEEKRLAVSP